MTLHIQAPGRSFPLVSRDENHRFRDPRAWAAVPDCGDRVLACHHGDLEAVEGQDPSVNFVLALFSGFPGSTLTDVIDESDVTGVVDPLTHVVTTHFNPDLVVDATGAAVPATLITSVDAIYATVHICLLRAEDEEAVDSTVEYLLTY